MVESNAVYWVYMLKCADGTFYTGQTMDLEGRVALHNAGKAARYTRGRRPVELAYAERVTSRGEALRREQALRKLPRKVKETLITTRRTAD